MTEPPPPFDFSQLTVPERIRLVQQIWESIPPDGESHPLSDTQKRVLDRRWAAFMAGDIRASSWAEVKNGIQKK